MDRFQFRLGKAIWIDLACLEELLGGFGCFFKNLLKGL